MLGALVDVGLPLESLKQALTQLKVGGFRISAKQEHRAGLAGTRILVEIDKGNTGPRAVSEFIAMVALSSLSDDVKQRATRVFQRLGEAEARAHRTAEGEGVLHELGDLDTLVDVVGTVAGLHILGIGALYASPLLVGNGMVHSSHGLIPAPAPATMELIANAQAPVLMPTISDPTPGELTTPTGAALLTTLARFEAPQMTVDRVGYGLGSRDDATRPNALGVWLGEEVSASKSEGLRLLETNVDDSTPEVLAYTQEQLLSIGALDVWFSSIQMKKNRPGVLLSALIPMALEGYATELILRETTTLGIRVRTVERYEAQREEKEVECAVGIVKVKVKRLGHRVVGISPEYEPCRRIAQEKGISLAEVYRLVSEAAWRQES